MFKIIVLGLGLIVAIVLGVAATRPDDFRVQRSLSIKAPPEKIAPLITDFHAWGGWSPYEKLDPQMQRNYGGGASRVGATYGWDSKGKAGQGSMEILDTSPSKITIKLDFVKPLEGHNTAEFTLQPQGDATLVTWSMHGPAPYISKVMGLFCNMDRMIGQDFEIGLANLKSATEK